VVQAAQRGYQLVIVGAAAPTRGRRLFTPEINTVIRDAACDVLVVSSSVAFELEHIKRIAVPFTGREPARAAADLAIAFASGVGAGVDAISVVREPPIEGSAALEQLERGRTSIANALAELRERAKRFDVPFESEIRTEASPSRTILCALHAREVDLCVLGVTDQSRRGTPFFGDTADLVLRFAPVPVALLVVRDRR
jgi:nucleotide-binding universal stress UspA family protein